MPACPRPAQIPPFPSPSCSQSLCASLALLQWTVKIPHELSQHKVCVFGIVYYQNLLMWGKKITCWFPAMLIQWHKKYQLLRQLQSDVFFNFSKILLCSDQPQMCWLLCVCLTARAHACVCANHHLHNAMLVLWGHLLRLILPSPIETKKSSVNQIPLTSIDLSVFSPLLQHKGSTECW